MRKMYQLPALENDGAELNLINDGDKYSPQNDQDLREILCIFVSNKKLKFTVFIETPSKPFSDWSFPKVCLKMLAVTVILRHSVVCNRLQPIYIKKQKL
jgi:hypothetical protein